MVRNFISRFFGSSSGSAEHSGDSSDRASSDFERSRLNDQVYLLRPGTNPQVDAVFFHGLPKCEEDTTKTFWNIWTMRNNAGECWPVTLLPELLATKSKESGDPLGYDPRVLAVSWDNKLELPKESGTGGTDSFLLTENLVQNLILDDDVGVGQKRPVILVGHDLGGILIKQLILYVEKKAYLAKNVADKDKLQRFLENLGSVFFYATPHSGSPAIEELAKKISEKSQNQMLKFMNVLGSDMARINSDFTAYRNNEKNKQRFTTTALFAAHLTNQGYFKRQQVCVEGAARNDIDHFYTMQADHYEVCQPEHPRSNNVTMLRDSIVKVVNACREDMKEKEEKEKQARFDSLKEFEKKLMVKDAGKSVVHDEAKEEVASTSSRTT